MTSISKLSIALLSSILLCNAYGAMKISFPKASKLSSEEQGKVVEEIKKQCPFITREEMIANSYSEVEKDGILTYKFTVQIPRGEDGDFDLVVVWDKGKVTVSSEGDYCQK